MARSLVVVVVIVVAIGVAACSGASRSAADGGDASGSIAARMNDVSILFPLPADAAGLDNLLAPSAAGARGVLLPGALYAAMGAIAGSGPQVSPAPGPAAYGDLRVVAMRIDPCFASLTPDPSGAGCTAQLRLIFEEVLFHSQTGEVGAFDSALHAFYQLSRTEFLALARSLVELRAANEEGDVLGSLAPHPIMVRQGLAGPMSQGTQRLILAYAGEQNLVRTAVAAFGGAGSLIVWNMSAFDVNVAAATATLRTVPTLVGPDGGNAADDGIAAGVAGGADIDVRFSPTTASDDDFAPLAFQPTSLSPSARQPALDALVRVENPTVVSAETIDCARCHLATPIEKSVALPLFGFDDATSPLAFRPDGKNVTVSDMQTTWNPVDFPNIHAFSYIGRDFAINQRVVNETAAVVEYLRAL